MLLQLKYRHRVDSQWHEVHIKYHEHLSHGSKVKILVGTERTHRHHDITNKYFVIKYET